MSKLTPGMTYKTAQRWAVAMGVLAIVIAGCAVILLPGPAFLVIFAALAVVGIEIAWARRWLRGLREPPARNDASRNAL